jgi:Zn-dependent M28 family amino/carboxypeptidase
MVAAGPRLQVEFDTYQVAAQGGRLPRDVELRNVVAVLPGRSPRRVYVTGHYDSVARRTDGTGDRDGFDWTRADNDAPGANDDGSGTALVMELARVFVQSGVEFDATLVFVAFAGEEEGLVGSTLHAGRASAAHWTIDAVLNNDIVGGSHGGDGVVDTSRVRVFSTDPRTHLRAVLLATCGVRRRSTHRRRKSCWRPGPIDSAAAAITRRSTRRASGRFASLRQERTTHGSIASRTRRKGWTLPTFSGTPA